MKSCLKLVETESDFYNFQKKSKIGYFQESEGDKEDFGVKINQDSICIYRAESRYKRLLKLFELSTLKKKKPIKIQEIWQKILAIGANQIIH